MHIKFFAPLLGPLKLLHFDGAPAKLSTSRHLLIFIFLDLRRSEFQGIFRAFSMRSKENEGPGEGM